MRFEDLATTFADRPLISSESLVVLGQDPKKLSVQISRWVSSGRLARLRRGLYLLGERHRRTDPPAEYIANVLAHPSYVSLESALSIHGLIPESVPAVHSVTTGRPALFETPAGTFLYRHVKQPWFRGYEEMQLGSGAALVAIPEKAILDLVYLSRGEFGMDRIRELRLEDADRLDPGIVARLAAREGSPRMKAAAGNLARYISEQLG